MKTTRRELIELYYNLEGLKNDGEDVEKKNSTVVNYLIYKNQELLQTIVDQYNEQIIPSAQMQQYELARQDLLNKYVVVDNQGQMVIENNTYKFTDAAAFETELVKLQEQHKDAIDSYRKSIEQAKTSMNDTITGVVLFCVDIKDLPHDLNLEAVSVLAPLIYYRL